MRTWRNIALWSLSNNAFLPQVRAPFPRQYAQDTFASHNNAEENFYKTRAVTVWQAKMIPGFKAVGCLLQVGSGALWKGKR